MWGLDLEDLGKGTAEARGILGGQDPWAGLETLRDTDLLSFLWGGLKVT
jgi:hypothetical protein